MLLSWSLEFTILESGENFREVIIIHVFIRLPSVNHVMDISRYVFCYGTKPIGYNNRHQCHHVDVKSYPSGSSGV